MGVSSWHFLKSCGKVRGLNDLEVHKKQVKGGKPVDSETYVNNVIEDFPVFAWHVLSSYKGIKF